MKKKISPSKKQKSLLVVLFLIWQLAVNILGLISYFSFRDILFKFNPILATFDVVGFIGFIVCIAAAWQGKKWGFLGLLGLYIIKIIEDFATGNARSGLLIFVPLIVLLFLLYTGRYKYR